MEELNLHPDYYNCNPQESGKPLCSLPTLLTNYGNPAVKNPQIMGCSLEELINNRRGDPLVKRNYSTFVITDYPTGDADRLGLPIVGDAQKVLCEFLTKAQFNPKETYITCHAKCAPPRRKASAGEYTECRRHLEYELAKYQPSLIILMGAECLKIFNFGGMGGITGLHGTVHNLKYPKWKDHPEALDYIVMPVFHPKQYLATKDERVRHIIQADFNKARGLLKDGVVIENTYYKAKFEVVENKEQLESLIAAINETKLFAFDTESPGLNFMQEPCITLQISLGEDQNYVIPFYKHDPEGAVLGKFKLKPHWHNGTRDYVNSRLKEVFENSDISKAAHNVRYDMNVLRRWCDVRLQGWLWDTQVMHHLLYTQPPHGLKELGDLEFHTGDWERDVHEIVGHGKNKIKTYDNIPDEVMHQYGATDAEVTFGLLDIYFKELQSKPRLLKLYEEESLPTIYTLAEAEYNGNHINKEVVADLSTRFAEEIEELTAACRAETQPDFNPGSNDQVAKALRSMGKTKEIEDKKSPSGYSVDKTKLMELDIPFADNIIKYRNRRKFKSTYLDNALSNLDYDGRIRYSFNQTGTISGRLSCRFLHQLPRSKEDDLKAGRFVMRDMIDEEDGFLIYYADYSQVELRVFAQLTGEEELINVLADPNGDIHALTAAGALMCKPEEVSKFNRSAIGKPLNFGTIYGSEGHAIARVEYEDPITGKRRKVGKDMALTFVRNFRQRYQKVNFFLDYIPELARQNGNRVMTVFGREIYIPDLDARDDYKRGHANRAATNAAIQSPAGAITIRTMNEVRRLLEQYDIPSTQIRLINTVHDSIAYGVREDLIEWFDMAFRQIAQRPIEELGGLQLPVEAGWGKTWGQAEQAAS